MPTHLVYNDQPPDSVHGATGVRLFFEPTRTVLSERPTVVGRPQVEVTADFPVIQLEWGGVAEGGHLRVEVEYQGEEPAVRSTFWLAPSLLEGGAAELAPNSIVAFQDHNFVERLVPSVDEAELGQFDLGAAWVAAIELALEDRRAAGEGESDDERKRAMAFFEELELATNPIQLILPCRRRRNRPSAADCSARRERRKLIVDASRALRNALEHRIRREVGGADADGESSLELSEAQLKALSSLQRSIYENHFGDPLEVEGLQRAFELFAPGELQRNHRWNARPDSSFYLLFAEFAIQCYQRGVDGDFWRAAIRTFVSTQEWFAGAYPAPHGAIGTYLNAQPRPLGSRADVEDLRTFYSGLDCDSLIEAHAANSAYLFHPSNRTLYSGAAP